MNKNIKIIDDKCCGCRNCEYICPKRAVSFRESSEGFNYPIVSEDCINCGACLNVCPVYSENTGRVSDIGYAAKIIDRDALKRSTSGGIFVAIATYVLTCGGVVIGCAEKTPGCPVHIDVEDLRDLYLLQGSKYVESDISGAQELVKKALDAGRKVLFTGVPCQVAAIAKIFGSNNDLFLVDVICHGVPSRKMYNSYLEWYEKKHNGKLLSYKFRSKKKHGWSLTYRTKIKKRHNAKFEEKMASLTPYYDHFLKAYIYRESCYKCIYADKKRVSDITLGDFWGVENISWDLYDLEGMSAVLVNTDKGFEILKVIKKHIKLTPVNPDIIRINNGQLNKPSDRPAQRDEIYKLLNNYGYEAVYKTYKNTKCEIIDSIKDKIPNRFRVAVKKKFEKVMFNTKR